MKNSEKRMIWTSDLYFDEESIKDWWRGQCEFDADAADYRDLCARMGIDADKLTDAQITALETLVPAYRETLMEREPDMDLWAEQYDDWLEAQRVNLDMPLCGYVVAVADLGFWDGRRVGIRRAQTDNLNEILWQDGNCGFAEVYADEYNIRSRQTHHDGTHRILYRYLPWEGGDEVYADLLYKAKRGELTIEEVVRKTQSLLPYVAGVYGWDLKNYRQREKAGRIAEGERKRHETRNAA